MPFTLAKDVKPGTHVGVQLNYVACTDDGCGPDKKVEVKIPVVGKKKPKVTPPAVEEEGTVSIKLADDEKSVIVSFEPGFGWYFYLPGTTEPGKPISIQPKDAEGVTWGKVSIPPGNKLEMPLEVKVPFERKDDVKLIQLDITWQGCTSDGQCMPDRTETFGVAFSDAAKAVVESTGGPKEARGEVAFPVIDTDDLGDIPEDEGDIAALVKEKGLFFALGVLFLIGAGLAFTPCVFPIIPLVVATIGGGAAVPKKRLAVLLGTYVLGLCLAFSSMGLIAAFGGGSMSAAFESATVQYAFVILFILLAFGMLGLFELQPPQWLMKLQGGAQNRSGSILGCVPARCAGGRPGPVPAPAPSSSACCCSRRTQATPCSGSRCSSPWASAWARCSLRSAR